jgi:predicted Zn-dependent protease
MPDAPSLADLARLAERAVGHAETEAQATVLWERRDGQDELVVDVTAVVDGRAAQARATGTDDEQLRRAAHAAAALARRPRAWPSAGLPEPLTGRGHDGFDPAALRPAAPPPEPIDGVQLAVVSGASRIAIASTKGVRAAEQRSYAIATATVVADGRRVQLRRAAVSAAGFNLERLAAHAQALRRGGERPVDLPAGALPVVLGPDAVAMVLDHLRAAFGVELDLGSGPLAGRFGTRVAAAAINLSDSPRYHSTLPRALDAEGLPRRPVPLIQDGVAHRRVHDSASAARAGAESTGHATRAAALAPIPEHLVLVGGGAAGIDELCAPIARGLYVPALSAARHAEGDAYRHATAGAILVEAGAPAAAVRDTDVWVDPLAVLASVEALTSRSATIPMSGHAPGGIGAAVVPAIRCAAGVWRAESAIDPISER